MEKINVMVFPFYCLWASPPTLTPRTTLLGGDLCLKPDLGARAAEAGVNCVFLLRAKVKVAHLVHGFWPFAPRMKLRARHGSLA